MADLELQSAEQQQLIEHLKVMIREREESLQTKEAQLKESNAKVAKLKLQTKAKDTKLRQLEGKGATSDAALTDKSDAEELSRLERGHAKLFKKRVEEKEKIIIEKDEIIKIRENQIEAKERVLAERETMMLDLRAQLQQKTEAMEVLQSSSHGDSGMDEMYAQIVYKDKKLLELNNKILEQERQVMDLQEYVSEKNEVIRGRDKVIEILQSSLKDKDQNVQDQAMLIAKLTSKVEKSEEQISLLSEQLQKKEHDLKIETDRFSLKLSESQKYFEETLSEKEAELKKLHENISIKDREVLTSQNDLREIINRHERDIQSIMSKSSLNIEDTVIKMMEQKIKDSNEVLEGKIKVVEIMQSEMTKKDEELSENREALRTLKDKLQVTSEQLMLIQSNFVDMEEQWKEEKCKLETKVKKLVEKHETEVSEKDLQMQSLQISLTQYENVYVQASVQYSALQERYQQTFNELQKLKEGDQPQVQTLQSSSASDFEELRTINESLKAEIVQKNEQLEILKKPTVEDTKSEKSETKMLKMKAQMTAKIKNLEKELEGLRQGSNLADEMMTLKNKLVEMEEEKGNLQLKLVDFDEQKSVQAQLEVKLSQLEEEKEKLSCEIRELQSNLHVTNDEKEKFSQIVTDLQCSVDENQVQHDITQSGLITSLQSEVEEIRVKKDQLEKEVEEGRCKFIKLEEENKAYQGNKLERETDIDIMQGRINELETKLSSLDSSDSEMKNKISSLETEKVSLEMKMVEFEKQREGSEEDKAKLYSEIKSLNEIIENEKQAKIVLEKENEELQTKIQQMEKSVEHSKTELTSLKQENSEFISKLDNLEKEKFESTRNVENNFQELQEANQTKVLLEQQLQTSKHKIEKLEETLKTTVITLEEITRNLSESTEKLSSSEHKVVNLEQELSTSLEKYQAELQDLRGRNEVLEGDVHFHQNESEEKSNTIVALKTQINDKDNEIKTLQSLVREKSDEYAELELHVKKVTRELEIAKEGQPMKGVEFDKKSQSLLYQISDLESEILEHKKTSTELQDTILKLQYELDSSKSEFSAVTNLLSEKNDEITSLRSQLKELALSEKSVLDMLESEKNSVQALQTENSSLKSSIEKLNSDLSEISILKDNLNTRCQELSKELVVKEDIIASLRAEVNSVCDIRQEQEHELQSLRAQIVEFQNDIEQKDSEFVIISDKYKSANNELVSQIETLKAEKTELFTKSKSEVEHLQETLSNKEQTLSELNLSMESDTSTTKLLLEEKGMQIQKLENDIELLIKEKHSLLETVQTLESSLSTMKSDVNVKSNLCMEKDSQIQVLNAEIQDATLKILSLESTVQKSFSEKVTFENQVVKLQKELAEHSYQNQQLRDTMLEMNNKIQNYAETVSKLQCQLDSQDESEEASVNYNEKFQILTSQLQEAIDMKSEIEVRYNQAKEEFTEMADQFSRQLQGKADEMVNLQSELEKTRKDVQMSNNLLQEKDVKIKSLVENIQEMDFRLSQLTENETVAQELEKAKLEIEEKQQVLDDKVLTLKKALATVKKLKFQLEKSDEKMKVLESGREEEQKKNEELYKELQEKNFEVKELKSSMQSLKTDVITADTKELDEIKSQMQSYVEYSQQLQEQVQQLSETIFKSEKQLKQKQAALDDMEEESSKLKTETIELKTANDCLKQEIEKITQINEDHQHTVLLKEKHILKLSRQIEDLDSGYLILQQQLTEKDDENSSLMTENTRLNVLESSFEDKLEELSKFHSILHDLQLTSPDQLQEKLAFSAQQQSFLESTLRDFTDLEKEFDLLKTQFDENESSLSKFRNMEHLLTEKNEQVKSLEFLTKQMMQEKEQLELKLDELQTKMLDKIDHKDKEQDVYVESSNSMKQKLMEIEGTEQKDELEQEKTENISQDIFRDGLPKPQVTDVAIQTIDSDEETNVRGGEQSLLEISAEHVSLEHKYEEEEQLIHQAKQIALQPVVSHEEAISESSLSELIIEHESLKLKYEELESEKNRIQKLNSQLQEEKDIIKADFEMQIAVVENLQHLLKENQMTIDQLHARDEDLNTKFQVLKADNDKLKVEMESLQGQCEGLEQIVASAQMSEMDAKHLLSELHNQLEKVQNENTSLHEEMNKLQESSYDKVQQFADRVEEPLVREVLHQTSSIEPSKVENNLLEENEKLKNKLHINEVKCEKMLYKLKAFKDKNDKLTTEVENLKKSKDHVDNGVYDKSVLETSLEKCKLDLKNSTSSCRSLNEENDSLKQMVASLKKQIQTFQNELETKVKEEEIVKSKDEQKIVSLSAEIENLKELMKVQDISLQSTTDKYHIANSNIKDLHVQLEALTFREESLNQRLDEQTRLADELSEKLRRNEEELAFLRPVQTELSEVKAHHDQSLSDLNENFSMESSSLKNKLACLQEQYNMLEADNQEFLILSDNLRETVQNLKKDNEEKSYLLSKKDEEISTKQFELSALSAQLTIIERVRDDLLEEKESLKSELLQWNTKDDKETKTIQELERVLGDNEDMKAKMVELESERDELVEEMEGLREDMIKAKGDKIANKNEFKKYEAQIDILKTDNQALKEQIDGLAWKLEEASGYEEELEVIRQQLNSLEVEKVARQSSYKEENDVKVNNLEVTHSGAESEVEEKKTDAELLVSNEKLSMEDKVDEEKLKLTEEISECKVKIEKQNRQLNELNFRLQTLDDLEVEFSELNEQYNKALNDKNDLTKQIQELHDKLQKLNNVEKEISLIVEQKDHFAREKETLQQRVNDLESQGKTVLDENAKLNQELTMLKTSLQQMTFDSNTLKSQLHVASSNGDQKSQFQSEYDNLQKQFNKAIEQKNKSVEDLNEAYHDHQRLEQRCQQLAMQVSQLAEDRSYLNAQLGLLSKSLREKENDWSNMKNQYRSLYQTHMMTQMKMADLEKRIISETFQKAHGSSTKSSVLGHVIPDPSLVEKYKQKLQISERFAEESVQTLKELQAKLEKEEKRSNEIEKMLRDTQDELLLHATKPLKEVRLQLEEDESDSRIREYNAFLTRRGMGYCRRLQRWMKVKNRQLTRIMKFRPSIRKCLWAYFILIHVLMVACFTGFL